MQNIFPTGAETVVDVWLYCDEEMLKHEFVEDPQPALEVKTDPPEVKTDAPEVKKEPELAPLEDPNRQLDSWFDFFNKENVELDVDEMIIKAVKKEPVIPVEEAKETTNEALIKQELIAEIDVDTAMDGLDSRLDSKEENRDEMETVPQEISSIESTPKPVDEVPVGLLSQTTPLKKRIMKYMEPNTGKIYYLEMDRDLDLTKVTYLCTLALSSCVFSSYLMLSH